jgi:hypothetical protein
MKCPMCKYEMSEFDTQCPRCHGEGIGEHEPESEIDKAITEIIDRDDDPVPGQSIPTIVIDETNTMSGDIPQVTDEETAQPVALKTGTFTIDDSNTLPEDFELPEEDEEFTFERKAPGGNALWIAAIYMLGVALFALVIYYVL